MEFANWVINNLRMEVIATYHIRKMEPLPQGYVVHNEADIKDKHDRSLQEGEIMHQSELVRSYDPVVTWDLACSAILIHQCRLVHESVLVRCWLGMAGSWTCRLQK